MPVTVSRKTAGEQTEKVENRDDRFGVTQIKVTMISTQTPTHGNKHHHGIQQHPNQQHPKQMHTKPNSHSTQQARYTMHDAQCKHITHIGNIESGGRQKGKRKYDNTLLIRAGDIETNPGPTEEEDECYACQKKFRRGVKFLTCKLCPRKSHKKEECSRTKKGQVKDDWSCHECRKNKDEQDQCRECKTKTRKGQILLKCVECMETMHKREECSKMKRSRLEYINLAKWKCTKCSNPERYEKEKNQEQERLERTGSRDKRKCRICKQLIRATHNCLSCTKCKQDIHLKKECSGESREGLKKLDRDRWECVTCTELEAEKEKRENTPRINTKEIEYITKGELNKSVIRVLQWNADSFLSKKEEFRAVITKHKIDVFLVQETKMTQKDKIPTIPGYTILSKPRQQAKGNENNRGGGLITGVKNTIPYREVEDIGDCLTEWLTIEIPISNKKAWRISNIYIPPERADDCRGSTEGTKVSTKYWPSGQEELMAGDFNAHSILWDETLETESNHRGIEMKRGEMIEEWLDDRNMSVLNNGKTTHTNRRTGKESTPDITIVHSDQSDRYQWEILEKLGGSDHKPILITREAEGVEKVNDKYTYKWDLKNANFVAFAAEVEEKLPENYETKNVHKLEKILRKTITKAATTHVGVKRVNRDSKPAITKEIKEKIEERNMLRKDMKKEGGRKKWIDKCKVVGEMIRKEKEERWREYVDQLDAKTNCTQVWKTIRSMDGRIAPRKENEVLVVEDKAYVSDKEKAKQFAKVYKKVSKIKQGPKDRIIKRQNRKFLKSVPTERSKYEREITWEELERVTSETNANKAPGDDTIPYDIIKQLDPKAKKYILHIYNRIWNGEPIPQRWRTAVIKPILKEGKDPKSPGSWRPISLTACLGKILEKIIADRLTSYMESNQLLNENQAGFRKERCTTDQVHKLVQMASDKMHEDKDGTSTIVTFFDFSRAYDKVWREGLLAKMIKLNVPYRFIKYTRLFLSARKTVVEINGVRSNEFYLNEGLPQGSAISPLLFLLFINDITEFTKDRATPSLFADDTAIWIEAGKDKNRSVKIMQENIDGIGKWANEWKMELNSDKTQVMIISTSQNDIKWQPALSLNGRALEVVNEYKFLGVIIDSGLRFTAHVNKVVAKCRRRNNILRCLAGKDWGQNMETQKALYSTYIRSAIEYASPSWYPWLSDTSKERLEAIQNESLRIMTRMARDSPCDFLRLQTGVEPLMHRMEKNSRIMRERYMRLDTEDGRRMLTEMKVKQRLKTRVGWRAETQEMAEEKFNRDIEKAMVDPMTPLSLEITEVQLEKRKSEYSADELRRMTDIKIAEVDADVEIYTDGSTAGDQKNGGAGIFAQDRNGNTLMEKARPAGKLCSSYDGESVACLEAVKWIEEKGEDGLKYAIFTDSLSLVCALRSNKWKDSHEWMRAVKNVLQRMKQKVTLCWVPSHCDTYGNDKADRLADKGAAMNQEGIPITYSIAKAKIRSQTWKVKHERAAEMFGDRRKPKEEEKQWTENMRRTYARIRCNHAKELRSYQKRIKMTSEGICIYCDTDEEETVEHVLCRCPQLELTRREVWPEEFNTNMLVTHPELCRKVLGRRYPALRRVANPEKEGGGNPSDCGGHQA